MPQKKTRFNTSIARPSHLPTDGNSLRGWLFLFDDRPATNAAIYKQWHFPPNAISAQTALAELLPCLDSFCCIVLQRFSAFQAKSTTFVPTHPFMASILHFSLSIVMLALFSSAQFVSREQIRQSSVRCCPGKFRQCCEQRMLSDERIHCGESLSTEKALAIAVCLEKQLHGGESVIERRAHKCCWLLSERKGCQRRCYDQLRAPSIPPTQKFTFTDECPSLTLNVTVPISELNCVTDREAVVHSCFSACLHWWENNRATAGQQVRHFDPSRDCPALVELSKSESCMIPEELLELARRDEVKGTTNGKKNV